MVSCIPWPHHAHNATVSTDRAQIFHGTGRIITTVTIPCHWSLSSAIQNQSTSSQLTSIRYMLILSSYICLGLPSHLFDSNFPHKIILFFQFLPISYMPYTTSCPIYLINSEKYRVWSSLSWRFVQHPISSHTTVMHNSSATLQISHSITGSMEQMFHLLM